MCHHVTAPDHGTSFAAADAAMETGEGSSAEN
jgi:hypothetical protein